MVWIKTQRGRQTVISLCRLRARQFYSRRRKPRPDRAFSAMTSDGATTAQLTDDQGSSYSPTFSPDGKRITFAVTAAARVISIYGSEWRKYLAADASTRIRKIASLHSHRTRNPSFSYPIRPETIPVLHHGCERTIADAFIRPGAEYSIFAFLPLPLTLFNQ